MKQKCLPSVNYKFFYVRKLLKMPSKERKRKELRTIGEMRDREKHLLQSYYGGCTNIKLFLILILAVDKANNP